MNKANNTFSSKIGLVAATVGSAVGLGNIWRFPSEVQSNGGAIFLLIYILCVVVLGIPVMLGEFSLGRSGRSDTIGVFKRAAAGTPWWIVGLLAVVASYLIMIFYMVVAGWTLEYLTHSVSGDLYSGYNSAVTAKAHFIDKMQQYTASSYAPIANTWIMIVINMVVLCLGVKKGIERVSNLMMPILFVVLLVLLCASLSLPDAWQGVKYFLQPDFDTLSPSILLNALGQAFFSLSLGMGILITYASYFPADTRLVRTAVTVSSLDLLVAVIMGLIIFPAVTSLGLNGEGVAGATLVFVTLPEVFAQMPYPALWSLLFFLLLTVAALTSTISVAEVSVACIADRFKLSRIRACLLVMSPLFVLSGICSLSVGPWKHATICGMSIFDFLDYTATNIMLPLGSLLMCVFLGWFDRSNILKTQLANHRLTHRNAMANTVAFAVRYVAPVLILLVLISNFL